MSQRVPKDPMCGCSKCGQNTDETDLASFGELLICAQCKTGHVQKLKEGVFHRSTRFACPQCCERIEWKYRAKCWKYGIVLQPVQCPSCGTEIIWEKRPAYTMLIGALGSVILAVAMVTARMLCDQSQAIIVLNLSILVLSALASLLVIITFKRMRFRPYTPPSDREEDSKG